MPDEEAILPEAETLPTTPPEKPAEEPIPMLDVHPAHHAASTWKEFFIHIATIVLGLLIAVGLEQTVVYLEQRHQLAETRESLRVERHINAQRFAIQTREFQRFVPKLKTNLAILMYLKEHPHAPPSEWPGKFDWLFYSAPYFDTAWASAVQDHVVERMSVSERDDDAELVHRLDGLTSNMERRRSSAQEARAMWIQTPDPSRMSPQQVDQSIAGVTRALVSWYESARLQTAFHWPDFTPRPTLEELELILPPLSTDPESLSALQELRRQVPELNRELEPK